MGGTFLATGSKDNSVKIWELVETGCDFLFISVIFNGTHVEFMPFALHFQWETKEIMIT